MRFEYRINPGDNDAECLINYELICLISNIDNAFRTIKQIIPLKVYHNRVRVNSRMTSNSRIQFLQVIGTMVLL